jgi:alpha-galactosidase
VIDHTHSQGLKFGLYTAMSNTTCAKYAASCEMEEVDAKQYADWKVDYLKDDCCGSCTGGTLGSYSRMAKAINNTGRDIVLSIEGEPPIATVSAGGYGNLRRVGHDIRPEWYVLHALHALTHGRARCPTGVVRTACTACTHIPCTVLVHL